MYIYYKEKNNIYIFLYCFSRVLLGDEDINTLLLFLLLLLKWGRNMIHLRLTNPKRSSFFHYRSKFSHRIANNYKLSILRDDNR